MSAFRGCERFLQMMLFWTLLRIGDQVMYSDASPGKSISLPLELSPPRLSSTRFADYRGFPSRVEVHQFSRALPLSTLEHVRWHALRALRMDRTWREQRLRPGPIFTTEKLYTADLLGGIARVGEYYTKIEIGGQKVRVQVDTGSSTLALPMAECRHCRPSDLRYNMKLSKSGIARWILCTNELCTPDKCSTSYCKRCSANDACCAEENPNACAFYLVYGDGSYAHGALVVDTLSWGGNLTAPVVFGGILRDSDDFERNIVDGILGMAYASLACNPTCVEPPFQQMVKAGVVKDKFSICMTDRGGKLILGDFDSSMAKGPVSYVPLALSSVPTYYNVNLTGVMSIDESTISLPNFQVGVVDSGTTLIAVSKITFALILSHMMEHYCHIPHICGSKSWFLPASCVIMSDDILNQLPTFTFHLGPNREFGLKLRPEDYMIKATDHGREVRCVGFMTLETVARGTDVIFGNTIMLRYITVYDRENKMIGFAESAGTCGSPPECGSYAKCDECAAESDACAFNLLTKTCVAKSEAGLGVIPFPICRGSSCVCGLGPRTFLMYGVVTGFVICALVVIAVLSLTALASMIAGRYDSRSKYEIGNETDGDVRDEEPEPLIGSSRT